MDADGLRDADGLSDAEGLMDDDGLMDADTDVDGLRDADGDVDGANFPKSSMIVVTAASRALITDDSAVDGLADADTDADGIAVIATCGTASAAGADRSSLLELYRSTMTFLIRALSLTGP